jgi:hypothetical protein
MFLKTAEMYVQSTASIMWVEECAVEKRACKQVTGRIRRKKTAAGGGEILHLMACQAPHKSIVKCRSQDAMRVTIFAAFVSPVRCSRSATSFLFLRCLWYGMITWNLEAKNTNNTCTFYSSTRVCHLQCTCRYSIKFLVDLLCKPKCAIEDLI